MSEIRGKQGFESPPPQDLENYLRQGRKSVNRMKKGKPPLKFHPRRSISMKFVAIAIFILISSSLFIVAPFLSLNPSDNNSPINNQTSTTTPTSQTTTTTTTQIVITDQDLRSTMIDLEGILAQMIPSNHSLITPVMLDGAVNFSHAISEEDLLDFIWYLSQFDSDSDWWELGKELIAERSNIWNESTFLSYTIPLQLKTLRSLLAYPSYEISLGITDTTSFEDTCIALWENITRVYSNITHLIVPSENDSIVKAADQIVFLDVLAQTINQQTLFNNTQVENIALEIINKFSSLTANLKGIPDSFSANLSWLSPIYKYKDQGRLILSLDRMFNILTPLSIIEDLILRLSNFQDDFREEDWSLSSEYNHTSKNSNQEFFLTDQVIGVRVNTKLEKLNVASYLINTIRTKFEASDLQFKQQHHFWD
ncbi:MAG: hypothetical protein ACTSQ9_05650 [Candidatus Hodarchaeales archaeon]